MHVTWSYCQAIGLMTNGKQINWSNLKRRVCWCTKKFKKRYRYPLLRLRHQREMEICKQQSEIEVRHLPAISKYGYVGGRQI